MLRSLKRWKRNSRRWNKRQAKKVIQERGGLTLVFWRKDLSGKASLSNDLWSKLCETPEVQSTALGK